MLPNDKLIFVKIEFLELFLIIIMQCMFFNGTIIIECIFFNYNYVIQGNRDIKLDRLARGYYDKV